MERFTQKSFGEFTEALNHRMTRIEGDVKWLKMIGLFISAQIMIGIIGIFWKVII